MSCTVSAEKVGRTYNPSSSSIVDPPFLTSQDTFPATHQACELRHHFPQISAFKSTAFLSVFQPLLESCSPFSSVFSSPFSSVFSPPPQSQLRQPPSLTTAAALPEPTSSNSSILGTGLGFGVPVVKYT